MNTYNNISNPYTSIDFDKIDTTYITTDTKNNVIPRDLGGPYYQPSYIAEDNYILNDPPNNKVLPMDMWKRGDSSMPLNELIDSYGE